MIISTYLLGEPCGVIMGWCFKGGDTMSCFSRSLSLIYSSKYRRILLSLKFMVILLGSALMSLGGIISFIPPLGAPLLAHCTKADTINAKNKNPNMRCTI